MHKPAIDHTLCLWVSLSVGFSSHKFTVVVQVSPLSSTSLARDGRRGDNKRTRKLLKYRHKCRKEDAAERTWQENSRIFSFRSWWRLKEVREKGKGTLSLNLSGGQEDDCKWILMLAQCAQQLNSLEMSKDNFLLPKKSCSLQKKRRKWFVRPSGWINKSGLSLVFTELTLEFEIAQEPSA